MRFEGSKRPAPTRRMCGVGAWREIARQAVSCNALQDSAEIQGSEGRIPILRNQKNASAIVQHSNIEAPEQARRAIAADLSLGLEAYENLCEVGFAYLRPRCPVFVVREDAVEASGRVRR